MAKSDLNGTDWFWICGFVALMGWFGYKEWGEKPSPPAPVYVSPASGVAEAVATYKPPKFLIVTQLTTGTIWYMDTDSVRGPREKRIAWFKEDHSKDKTMVPRESYLLYSFDCETTAYKTLSLKTYNRDGKVIDNIDYADPPTRYAVPASNIGSALEEACDQQFDPKPTEIPRPTKI